MKKYTFYLLVILLFSCSSNTNTEGETGNTNKEIPTIDNLFDYVTPSPTQPIVQKAVIDVNENIFSYYIIEIGKYKNWKLLKKVENKELFFDTENNTEEINERLRRLLQEIVEYKNVQRNHIYFVSRQQKQYSDLYKLVEREIKNIGFSLRKIPLSQQISYSMSATYPFDFDTRSFLCILSPHSTLFANVKQGAMNKYPSIDSKKIEYVQMEGYKYYAKEISNASIKNNIKTSLQSFVKKYRPNCFVIGGVSFLQDDEKNNDRFISMNNKVFVEADRSVDAEHCEMIFDEIQKQFPKDTKFIYSPFGNYSIGYLIEQ